MINSKIGIFRSPQFDVLTFMFQQQYYNVCLENGSDQLIVYRRIDRQCIYEVSQSADPNSFSRHTLYVNGELPNSFFQRFLVIFMFWRQYSPLHNSLLLFTEYTYMHTELQEDIMKRALCHRKEEKHYFRSPEFDISTNMYAS